VPTLIQNISLTERDTRKILLKWVVVLLVPLLVFMFVWRGYVTVNQVLFGFISPASASSSSWDLIQTTFFLVVFFASSFALAGYLVAADSGRQGLFPLWIDMLAFAVLPLLLINATDNLLIGLSGCAILWAVYFPLRRVARNLLSKGKAPSPLASVQIIDQKRYDLLLSRAKAGGFWLSILFALIWLIIDIVYFAGNQLPTSLFIAALVRTFLFLISGYFLGTLGGRFALRNALKADVVAPESGEGVAVEGVEQKRRLEKLSATRAKEEAKDLVPNDMPLRSRGALRFFLILAIAFVIFYPVLDPFLFGSGSNGRIDGYGDAGYYVILALGLNIVVGFAGLLDLGYVAFFAIGAYTWGMVGSNQLSLLTGIPFNPQLVSWLFWPMLIVTALVAAFWGVVLGAPTLRLRGDYLAIVTLGFGEIVPVVFLNLNKYTNGTNGLVGIRSPAFFGIQWSTFTPLPYYYLILVLIAVTIFANIRLRDSRLGRAWVAIREDEIAAASSGVNLVRTKLFAFAAGAFFSGLAGAYHSAKLGGVSPDTFGFGDSVIYLAMVVIGGIGSIPGVIVGALTVYAVNLFVLAQLDTLANDPTSFMYGVNQFITHYIPSFSFGNIRNLIFGTILVIIMLFRPEGLIPSARRRRELHQQTNEDGAVESSSLDVVPGAPGFESEIRVE
jgi:ABC-type branched-subunit amino acid transport system permease subunit